MALKALIFDCDGTLAETEEAHRTAFNRAFADTGLDWHWTVDRYRELLKVTGGRERIAHFIDEERLPMVDIPALHTAKNRIYARLADSGAVALRPGITALIEAARTHGIALAIATTTSRANIEGLIAATGLSAIDFQAIVTGEDVTRKKPDPECYLKALDLLALAADECLAFEDAENGLRAAHAAGIKCVVSPSFYMTGENLAEAALVVPSFEDIYGLAALEALL